MAADGRSVYLVKIRPKSLVNGRHDICKDKYILLDVLLCSITEYFYELRRILASPKGEWKYKQQLKILSDTTQRNV